MWLLFIIGFALAGAMNLWRGMRRFDERRTLSIGLGIAGFLWAASAALFRFVDQTGGYAVAAIAAVVMIGASLTGLRRP
jgi:hypothetical protein